MSDNAMKYNNPSSGLSIADQDQAGVHVQRFKVSPHRIGGTAPTPAVANLGNGGVYTQDWQDANFDGPTLVIALARADQVSAALGFVIEETDDEADANLLRTVASAAVAINVNQKLYAVIRARKYRIKYTNGATPQTAFKIVFLSSPVPLNPVDPDAGIDADEISAWCVTVAPVDNAAATVSKAGVAGKTHFVTGISASFSAAVAGKLLTLKDDTTVIGNYHVHNQRDVPVPKPIKITQGKAAELSLAASGSGGTLGTVTLTGFTIPF